MEVSTFGIDLTKIQNLRNSSFLRPPKNTKKGPAAPKKVRLPYLAECGIRGTQVRGAGFHVLQALPAARRVDEAATS